MRIARSGVVVSLALLTAAPAWADSLMPPARYAHTQLADPRQEAKAVDLMETLRCIVCQGQSIADSDAEIAGDMRHLVRSRIAAGEHPRQIRTWLVERYGDWISYRPPTAPIGWPLWSAPLLLLLLGALLVRKCIRLPRR